MYDNNDFVPLWSGPLVQDLKPLGAQRLVQDLKPLGAQHLVQDLKPRLEQSVQPNACVACGVVMSYEFI
jgi:hypothetical protein